MASSGSDPYRGDVTITPIDIHDDAQLKMTYDVSYRAEMLGREDAPNWTYEEFVGAIRSPDSGERLEMFGAYVDDDLVGVATLYTFLLDNTDKVWMQLAVDPPARRQGHGRALLQHVEEVATTDGRTVLMTDTKLPFEQVADHGYRRFVESAGYEFSNIEVCRYLRLPVDEELLQSWSDEAAERHPGIVIETFVDDVPEDLVPSLCILLGQLAVDAPTGAVDFEEGAMTPARFEERRQAVRAMGRTVHETLAITPERLVVAQSTLAVPLDGGTDVWQWGTFVHREYRGRRLGLAVKAANLRSVQITHPTMKRVVTQNGETNDHMVSINELMGFEPVEASVEFVKRF